MSDCNHNEIDERGRCVSCRDEMFEHPATRERAIIISNLRSVLLASLGEQLGEALKNKALGEVLARFTITMFRSALKAGLL